MASLLFTDLLAADRLLRGRDLLVCGAVDDGAEPAGGHLPVAIGRDRKRASAAPAQAWAPSPPPT